MGYILTLNSVVYLSQGGNIMYEIPNNYINIVNQITEEILMYNNKDNLSWTTCYKNILKKLKLNDKLNDTKLLSYVVKKLTLLGYDIEAIPFKLTKY